MTVPTVFITGTDTGVGKTHVARLLLEQASSLGIRCAGFKPVAAGGIETTEGIQNEDAIALQQASSVRLPYATVNPYALPDAIAPHIAAARHGVRIEARTILGTYAQIAAQADLVVVEGAGGWQVPLADDWLYSELVVQAGWPVLLVVGMRLGCLNHALLTAHAIESQSKLLGWIANCLPPTQAMLSANLKTLARSLPAPLLGLIPPSGGVDALARWPRLDVSRLMTVLQ